MRLRSKDPDDPTKEKLITKNERSSAIIEKYLNANI